MSQGKWDVRRRLSAARHKLSLSLLLEVDISIGVIGDCVGDLNPIPFPCPCLAPK